MQRKLAAILSADVVGFSGLMEADESGTLERLKANRGAVFDPSVSAHGGRLIKLMGDGALVEFPSVVSAVECALEIQQGTARNDSGIRYRIGVNLGDVIIDGDDLYGDGVNVAARLQVVAPVGGVALSGTVRDHVAGKIACTFEDLGLQTMKNIERPVQVFAAHLPQTPATQTAAPEEPKQLSICVLPFANMSGEQEQEYFSDGITEDIITDLSKIAALRVIARNTAFTFKGRNVDVPKVARQLGVTHILEGSVRKVGSRVRITAQLIHGVSNGHVWAERYDRDLTDIFALQDEISRAIAATLSLKLLPEESRAIARRGTTNLDAYNLYLMARQYELGGSLGGVRRAEAIVRLCQRATELDPQYARAWALLALGRVTLRFFRGGSPDDGLADAERALALDGNLAQAHAAKARVLLQSAQFDDARHEAEAALRLDPESYEVAATAGHLAFGERRFADAIRHYEKSTTLMDTGYSSLVMLMSCYAILGDMAGMRDAARRTLACTEAVVEQEPDNGDAMSHIVTALGLLGEEERARQWAHRAVLLDPDNIGMHYNLASAMAAVLKDSNAAIDLLESVQAQLPLELVNRAKTDFNLASLRSEPRFAALIAKAEARLGGAAA